MSPQSILVYLFLPLFKMAAAVVTGILLALAAVMFNFSVHKIDEGEIECLEVLSIIAVVSRFVGLLIIFDKRIQT